MTWEYLTIEIRDQKMLLESLNDYGAEGWELVAVTHKTYKLDRDTLGDSWMIFFKKPK